MSQPKLFEPEPRTESATVPDEPRSRRGPRRQRPYRLTKQITRRITDDLVIEIHDAGLVVRRYGRRKAVRLTWDAIADFAIQSASSGKLPGKLFAEPVTPDIRRIDQFTLAQLDKLNAPPDPRTAQQEEPCPSAPETVEPEPNVSTSTSSDLLAPACAVKTPTPKPAVSSARSALMSSRPRPRFTRRT